MSAVQIDNAASARRAGEGAALDAVGRAIKGT
jgi:hypothetical protein